ncbi:MAG: hypothetical protein MZU79_01615 [Anaerotruncus sp.]|nr:hypothetical protein [Anaerotruncus sp.]
MNLIDWVRQYTGNRTGRNRSSAAGSEECCFRRDESLKILQGPFRRRTRPDACSSR